MAILTQNTKIDVLNHRTIGFQENRPVFRRKVVKIIKIGIITMDSGVAMTLHWNSNPPPQKKLIQKIRSQSCAIWSALWSIPSAQNLKKILSKSPKSKKNLKKSNQNHRNLKKSNQNHRNLKKSKSPKSPGANNAVTKDG
jgi:hypothetical protein